LNINNLYKKLGYKNRMDYIISMSKKTNSSLEKDIKIFDNDNFDKFLFFTSTNEDFQNGKMFSMKDILNS